MTFAHFTHTADRKLQAIKKRQPVMSTVVCYTRAVIQTLKKWWSGLGTDRRWSVRFVGKETLIYREGDHELDFIHNSSQNLWDFELVAWRWNSHKSEIIPDVQRTLITERVKAWLSKNTKGRTLQFSWPT